MTPTEAYFQKNEQRITIDQIFPEGDLIAVLDPAEATNSFFAFVTTGFTKVSPDQKPRQVMLYTQNLEEGIEEPQPPSRMFITFGYPRKHYWGRATDEKTLDTSYDYWSCPGKLPRFVEVDQHSKVFRIISLGLTSRIKEVYADPKRQI